MSGPGESDDETGEPADTERSFSPDDDPPDERDPASPQETTGDSETPPRGSGGDRHPSATPPVDNRGNSGPDSHRPRQAKEHGQQSVQPNHSPGGAPGDRYEGQQDDEDTEDTWLLVSRDVVVTVLAVLLIGSYLFAISGVWPPMVAIESGSMEPNMNVNDMVFVMDTDRFQPDAAQGNTGVVTAQSGAAVGYTQYGKSGDVIIFEPGGDEDQTPIIHRAMFWVEEGEKWYGRANESYIGAADSCTELSACPAPNDGFITKGDANGRYDQASLGGSNNPVKPKWIIGTAEVRIPRLGWFRLQF